MLQVFQDQRAGAFQVLDVPAPACRPDGVLVAVAASLISAGTERSKAELGAKSLLDKARSRPDLVRQVVELARRDGVADTARLVRERLGTPQPLGYSAAGTVVEVGERCPGFQAGQPVAVAGAGYANHAEVCWVPAHLAAAVPAGVDPADACFATVGAIALQGIRQAELSPGETVVVLGLGLVGQLAARLLHAYGFPALGVDVDPAAVARAAALPPTRAWTRDDPALAAGVAAATGGRGADAVLITAATRSSDPVALAAGLVRDRGRLVVVGDVGLELDRGVFYGKELSLRLSRSYGPGRYDRDYEERGHDYPIGYVRWTEQRNLAEVLRLLGEGRLEVADLVTHRFPVAEAAEAFRVLTDPATPSLGILLTYPERPGRSATTIGLAAAPATEGATDRATDGATTGATDAAATRPRAVSLVGAGSFATRVLVPALVADGRLRLDTVVTRAGAAAGHVGRRAGFARAASDPAAAFDPARVGAAVIATRHDSHPDLVAQALQAGLAVLVEKPLAVDEAGLGRVLRAWRQHPGALLVGFNRRFAAPVRALLAALPARTAPGMVAIRVAAARLDPHHWAQDEREGGGRIAGELCHFVDLAAHLLGQAPAGVYARRADARGPRLANHVAVLLDFPDGSTAALQYHALGGAGMPKELVEAAWDGASGQIDDFKVTRTWTGGRSRVRRWRRQDKGHRAEVAAFVDWVCGGQPAWDPRDGLVATAATLAVLRSLAAGERIEVAAVLDAAAAAAGVDAGWA